MKDRTVVRLSSDTVPPDGFISGTLSYLTPDAHVRVVHFDCAARCLSEMTDREFASTFLEPAHAALKGKL